MKLFYLLILEFISFFVIPAISAETQPEQVVILGSGPAGLTAAIYAARAGLKPLVIEGVSSGGQLVLTHTIENFPGFPEGITGPDLIDKLHQQAERFGARFQSGNVIAVNLERNPFQLTFDDQKKVHCKALIIATGAFAKTLDLPAERALLGYGVSTCATCDGPFFKEKKVVVVGGGDSAFEEALFISRYASKVSIIHRRKEFRASKYLQERVKANPKIDLITDSIVADILDPLQKQVSCIKLQNLISHKTVEYPCDGVFIAIGHQPNTQLFQNKLKMNDEGYLITNPHSTATSIPGVFAAGDVADPRYRQAITAAGLGCMAAIDADIFLQQSASQDHNGNAEIND